MDQETFFDIGKFNPNEVDLDAVPSSAEAYLKQVWQHNMGRQANGTLTISLHYATDVQKSVPSAEERKILFFR